MRYLACNDVVINILQLISVHIYKFPILGTIKNPTCGYDFSFLGKKALKQFSFYLAAGVVDLATYSHTPCKFVKCIDLTSFRR